MPASTCAACPLANNINRKSEGRLALCMPFPALALISVHTPWHEAWNSTRLGNGYACGETVPCDLVETVPRDLDPTELQGVRCESRGVAARATSYNYNSRFQLSSGARMGQGYYTGQ